MYVDTWTSGPSNPAIVATSPLSTPLVPPDWIWKRMTSLTAGWTLDPLTSSPDLRGSCAPGMTTTPAQASRVPAAAPRDERRRRFRHRLRWCNVCSAGETRVIKLVVYV